MTSSPPSSQLTLAVPVESSASPVSNYRRGLRSLWHLSRHLTARADDNHAAPRGGPSLETAFRPSSPHVQTRVRFLAYHRIKPHVPPLVRAPVNSFEFHRWFTAWTTRVSNPVRSPRSRASVSVVDWRAAFAIGVPRDIYAFHRYTTRSARPIHTQAHQFQRHAYR